MLKKIKTLVAAASALGALSGLAEPAQAQYVYPGYPYVAVPAPVAPYPYLYGGRRYCWYDAAWNGPGWYSCGFAWRSGYGWGGGYGWNGWAWRGRGWRHR